MALPTRIASPGFIVRSRVWLLRLLSRPSVAIRWFIGVAPWVGLDASPDTSIVSTPPDWPLSSSAVGAAVATASGGGAVGVSYQL